MVDSESQTSADSASPRSRRTITIVIPVVVVMLLAVIVIQRWLSPERRLLADLPTPELSTREPLVAEKIRRLTERVRDEPRSATAWGRLGMNLDVHQMTVEAVQAYQQAARLDSTDFRWPYYSAMALRGLQSLEALEWFERALSLQPSYAPLLVRYGDAASDVGRLDDAAALYRRALIGNPALSHARLGLARIALAQRDLDAAERESIAAVNADLLSGPAHSLLAEVFRQQGRDDEAELEELRAAQLPETSAIRDSVYAAIVREGESSFWYLRRGRAYLQARDFEAASREFRRAVEIKPDAESHMQLGQTLWYLRSLDEAREQLQTALKLRPDYPQALTHLGSVLLETGDIGAALEYLERAKQLDPSQVTPYLRVSDYYDRIGRDGDAIAQLRDAREHVQSDYRVLTRLAWLLATAPSARDRNGAEAVRLAERAVDLTMGVNPEPLDALAAAYAETGQYGQAVEAARVAAGLAEQVQQDDLANLIEGRRQEYRLRRPHRSRTRIGGWFS